MKVPCFALCAGLVTLAAQAAVAADLQLASPDGKILVRFAPESFSYRIDYQGRPVIEPSRLGLELDGQPALREGFRVVSTKPGSHDETWTPVCGERRQVRNHYRELTVDLEETSALQRRLQLVFRVYDAGAAFCYVFPKQEKLAELNIKEELTEFRFTGNHRAHATYSAQGMYEAVTLDKVKPNCERPLVVETDGGPCIAIGEARLIDYARMRLRPVKNQPHTLAAMLGSSVQATTPYRTPWRVVMIADKPGQLIEHNDIFPNLNDPCAIADTSWIKPGKVIREVTLTTEGGKACVDFCVKMNLQYVEFDAGWYGHEYSEASDARQVNRDKQKAGAKGELNLQEVIRYGRERGVGVLLYVNRIHLERQLDELLPIYQQWGVAGLKYGFVQVGPRKWTAWLHDAIRKAADYRMMVDVHDEYRSTGNTRTWPNLMTVEGVRGNETMPPAENNLVLPFTRYLCGPADYTICWYDKRLKPTGAHQLALAVVYFSPWQFVFWYDRPGIVRDDPELAFFKHVPTVWDDTRVLDGQIGQYITLARRSGQQWFVGTIGATTRRQLKIPLAFLEPGRKYTAEIYADADPTGADRKVKIERRDVDRQTVLQADVAAGGGQAIRIVPQEK